MRQFFHNADCVANMLNITGVKTDLDEAELELKLLETTRKLRKTFNEDLIPSADFENLDSVMDALLFMQVDLYGLLVCAGIENVPAKLKELSIVDEHPLYDSLSVRDAILQSYMADGLEFQDDIFTKIIPKEGGLSDKQWDIFVSETLKGIEKYIEVIEKETAVNGYSSDIHEPIYEFISIIYYLSTILGYNFDYSIPSMVEIFFVSHTTSKDDAYAYRQRMAEMGVVNRLVEISKGRFMVFTPADMSAGPDQIANTPMCFGNHHKPCHRFPANLRFESCLSTS